MNSGTDREQAYINEIRGIQQKRIVYVCSVTPAVGGYDRLWHADAQKIHFTV